ncbi:uncharacterized protein [Cardiocondyla obscurior]|uniref:uncharacterized protein n=1 Tax=Cardiocondyla obscurior TaxID=286306 RepID=UPI00396562DC
MESDKEKDLQFQSDRTLRSRRGEGTVPALSPSLSYDGPPTACSAGAVEEHTPAKIEEKERQLPRIISNELVKPKSRRPGPKCAKAKKKANNFAYIRPSAGSPPPLEGQATSLAESVSRPGSPVSISGSVCDTEILDSLEEESGDSEVSIRTTASGSAKRYRRPCTPTSKYGRREADPIDLSSGVEEEDFSSIRKRGRPVVTGEGIEIQAIRAKKKVLQKLNEEIRTAKEILESAYDPADFKSKKRTAMAQRLEEEMANLPPRDIVAQVLQAAQQADNVAAKSTNLNGRFVRILREAALKIQVGTDALVCRQPADSINSKDSSESQEEIQRLRAEVSALRNELQTLRQQTKTGQEPPVVQQNMEVEMMDNGESITSLVCPSPLPQREKWPPVIRPALRGERLILEDGKESVEVKKIATPTATSTKDIESKWERKFSSFAEEMRKEMRRVLSAVTQQVVSKDTATGARKSGLADATKRTAGDRPVPGDCVKEDKGKKKKKNKVSPLPSSFTLPVNRGPSKKTGPSVLSTSKSATESLVIQRPEEQKWSQVIGRKASKKQKAQNSSVTVPNSKGAKGQGEQGKGRTAGTQKSFSSRKDGIKNAKEKKKSRRRTPRIGNRP